MKVKTPKVDLTVLERRALRTAIWVVLDDDTLRGELYDWQIKALQSAAAKIPPTEA